MVNYLYDLDDVEKNHEAFAQQRTVVASSAVTKLVRRRPSISLRLLGDQERPYPGTIAPRVTLLSGDARNRIVAATSSTFGQAA